ncbi:MAG TPA: cellulase family glycosylhydrolase [Vicinamibacterales bacterium]|nr:cellulase family glycosylhydrolase [Vicinamibacterales bacterium]
MKSRLLIILLVALLGGAVANGQGQTPVLGIQGDHFTVNGEPKFLLFISYFDAMRRSNAQSGDEDIDADLSYIKQQGFDGIRIFPNWWVYYDCAEDPAFGSDTLFTSGTSLRSGKLAVLKQVLDRAAYFGLLVDVSFSRENVVGLGEENPNSTHIANYKEQIRKVAVGLAGDYPHVFFDLANEFTGNQANEAIIEDIADAVRSADPTRFLLASTGGGLAAYDDQYEAGTVVGNAGLDVAGVHPPRTPFSSWYTNATISNAIAAARDGMDDSGISAPYKPVYIQEPMPISGFYDGSTTCYTHDPSGSHHNAAAVHAKENGAAAYTLHTRSAFKLDDHSYYYKLTHGLSGEMDALEDLSPAVVSAYWGATLSFTDSSIDAGSTIVKKVHLMELRSRVNNQRARFGLSPFPWTDPDPIIGTTEVKGTHITQLRSALAAAYTAHGLSAPSYTDSTITAQSTIVKATHIVQLRNAVVYLEQH